MMAREKGTLLETWPEPNLVGPGFSPGSRSCRPCRWKRPWRFLRAASSQKAAHQFMSALEGQVAGGGDFLVVGRLSLRFDAAAGQSERHRPVRVGAGPQRGAVVRRDEDAPVA